MRKTFLLVFAFGTYTLSAQQKHSPVTIERPADFEYLSAPDSTGKRMELKSPSASRSPLKLPYPVLFIHGLGGNGGGWDPTTNFMDDQYGFAFGGRFDFCLNYDANYYVSNTSWTSDADLALFSSTIVAGDYYYINFDVGYKGSVFPSKWNADFVKSNQSAIAKQGVAIEWAIEMILEKTGRDKVVLMGHSMGGLAAREYLQNPGNWQPDGQSHIAKLVTTGTPHGGSNQTGHGLAFLAGVDEQSDAVRDLRSSYSYSSDPGVYLFGGKEIQNHSHMNDSWLWNFYSVDVNCNGAGGENVIGLNQKDIIPNVDYACIIGDCDGCYLDSNPGDGIVSLYSANLRNFYPDLYVNTFYYSEGAYTEIHVDLKEHNYQNMEGLDEPAEYNLAYNVDFNTSYTGFITEQPADGYSFDFDEYKFSLNSNSNISVTINNIPLDDLMIRVVDASYNMVGTLNHSSGSSSFTFSQFLNAGDYYLEIFGTPTSDSYLHPYDFVLDKTAHSPTITGIDVVENPNTITTYPNPVKNQLTIETEIPDENMKFEILNPLGEIVYQSTLLDNKTIINTDNFSNGVYLIKFDSEKSHTVRKFIKE